MLLVSILYIYEKLSNKKIFKFNLRKFKRAYYIYFDFKLKIYKSTLRILKWMSIEKETQGVKDMFK